MPWNLTHFVPKAMRDVRGPFSKRGTSAAPKQCAGHVTRQKKLLLPCAEECCFPNRYGVGMSYGRLFELLSMLRGTIFL